MYIGIIEDEQLGRELLVDMLVELGYDRDKIVEMDSLQSARQTLDRFNPDLLFLDVRLGDGIGFEVISEFQERSYQLVITTGFDEYVMKALRLGATDYLLKPIHFADLEEAMDRVKKRNQERNSEEVEPMAKQGYLVLKEPDRNLVIRFDEIIAFEAKGNYTTVYTQNGDSTLSTQAIGSLEELLSERFFRSHRSWIINLDKVVDFGRGRGGKIELESGVRAQLAYRRKAEFVQQLQ